MHFSIPETQDFTNGSSVFTVSLPQAKSLLHNQSAKERTLTLENIAKQLQRDLFIQSSVGIGCEKFSFSLIKSINITTEHPQGVSPLSRLTQTEILSRSYTIGQRMSLQIGFVLQGLFAFRINTRTRCRNVQAKNQKFLIYFWLQIVEKPRIRGAN
jgi:hypothetical protein